jgi:SAM-dependent methyltransferase
MDVTNRFVLDFAIRHGGRLLDYGCGRGEVVIAARAAGLDAYGTDIYYAGAETRAPDTPFIRPMNDGHIPFEDGSFNLVTNNQVMEHVDNLDTVLGEIHRVLRPGGTVLSIFPSRDVWREGHIGIPFAHRLPPSRARFLYTLLLRKAGLGTWKHEAPDARHWAINKLAWIDRWTRYRSRRDIFSVYARYFDSECREADYIRYRLLDRPTPMRRFLVAAVQYSPVRQLGTAVFRKLAFLVILSHKR